MKNKKMIDYFESNQEDLRGYSITFYETTLLFKAEEIFELTKMAFHEKVIASMKEYLSRQLQTEGASKEKRYGIQSLLGNKVKLSLIAEKIAPIFDLSENGFNLSFMNDSEQELALQLLQDIKPKEETRGKHFHVEQTIDGAIQVSYRRKVYTCSFDDWQELNTVLWKIYWTVSILPAIKQKITNEFSIFALASTLWQHVLENSIEQETFYISYYAHYPSSNDLEKTKQHLEEKVFSLKSEQHSPKIQAAYYALAKQLKLYENEPWWIQLTNIYIEIVTLFLDPNADLYSPEVVEKLAYGKPIIPFIVEKLPIALYNDKPESLFKVRAALGAVESITNYQQLYYMEEDREDLKDPTPFCMCEWGKDYELDLVLDPHTDQAYLEFYAHGKKAEPETYYYPKRYVETRNDIEGYWGVYYQNEWYGFYLSSYEYEDEYIEEKIEAEDRLARRYDHELFDELRFAWSKR
ncbi:hypothetical protein [Dubosiella newyorkensis]|uniref:hypothetical protein n=1 Tax=Dubosiella newyorkensis TaxID=1862672 RepID=UPI0023F1B82C|nr:hypothetical protein [Dubosiella newyorkensis]